MIILTQNLDNCRTFEIIYNFTFVGNAELYKHPRHHHMQPFFCLIANDVQADYEVPNDFIRMWKKKHRIATFGSDEAWK